MVKLNDAIRYPRSKLLVLGLSAAIFLVLSLGFLPVQPGSIVRAAESAITQAVNLTIGTLPASKNVVITFDVTVGSLPQGTTQISNQGQVSGGNFTTVLTDDPAQPGTSDPTLIAAEASLTLRGQVQTVRDNLTALLTSVDSKTKATLQKAITKLNQALASDLWQADENHLTLKGETAFHRLRDAVRELLKIKNPPAAVTNAINTLVTVARTLAEQAISEAAGGNAQLLAKAQKEMTKAQQDLAKNKLANAMSHYEEAWEFAQKAVGHPVLAATTSDELSAEDEHSHEEESAAGEAAQSNRVFLPVVRE
jgi:hypothetical protein